jgi:formylmethanofuran dehydrogenase subunit C
MPLVISLRQKTSIPVEVDTVRLETVRGQSPDEVRSTLVQYGNKQLPLGEFFDVSGSAAEDDELVWEGDCSHVKLIGTHLSAGRVRVEGNAGMHLGAEMTGGEIVVTGNVGDWAGAEMHGGRIRIQGNAGHLVGAAYRGARRGMTGGEILIAGNAGNEIGHTMRRGLIAIGGRSGDAAGFGLIAGSIFLFGETGIRFGAGMKRGTIAVFPPGATLEIVPTFRYACTYQPVFLRFYLLHLRAAGFPVADEVLDAVWRRYCGDLLETGKGEILVRSH